MKTKSSMFTDPEQENCSGDFLILHLESSVLQRQVRFTAAAAAVAAAAAGRLTHSLRLLLQHEEVQEQGEEEEEETCQFLQDLHLFRHREQHIVTEVQCRHSQTCRSRNLKP